MPGIGSRIAWEIKHKQPTKKTELLLGKFIYCTKLRIMDLPSIYLAETRPKSQSNEMGAYDNDVTSFQSKFSNTLAKQNNLKKFGKIEYNNETPLSTNPDPNLLPGGKSAYGKT